MQLRIGEGMNVAIERSALRNHYRKMWMNKNQDRIAELYSYYDESLILKSGGYSKKPRFKENGFVNHLWKLPIKDLKRLGLSPDGYSSFKTKQKIGVI
jgi:hypothetical protein